MPISVEDQAGSARDRAAPAARRSLRNRIAELEAQLKSSQTKSSQMEKLRKFGTWEVDVDAGHLTWSEGTFRIFGLPPDPPITVERAMSFYCGAALDTINAGFAAALASGTPYDLTVRFTSASGVAGWVRNMGQLQVDGKTRRVVGVVEDVTAEMAVRDDLEDMAYRDALTGLPNRRSFQTKLNALVGQDRSPGRFALLIVDVDNFKVINDRYGHPVGDQVLCEVALRLRQTVTDSGLVARWSGDEFALIVEDVPGPRALSERASLVIDAMRATIPTSAGALPVTVSIGAALPTADLAGADELFRRADTALYRAKALGRDRACVYAPDIRRTDEHDLKTLVEIRHALDNDDLTAYYQPIVDLRTGVVRGLEALVRWRHPVRGILAPAHFEAALADPALSILIDDFVLARSLEHMRAWLDQGVAIPVVNVNVSDAQLRRPDLVERVTGLLATYRLTPDRLKLEIVESAFLGRGTEQVLETIARLAGLGVVCALDDFGTGYASLTHLRKFKVERIKIDRTFVSYICDRAFDRGLVRSIIDLGRNLGIRVTAEGVETLEQLSILREFGCDCAQGYLIGRPMAAEDVPAATMRWYGKAGAASQSILGTARSDHRPIVGGRIIEAPAA